jgi:hypothetical protein
MTRQQMHAAALIIEPTEEEGVLRITKSKLGGVAKEVRAEDLAAFLAALPAAARPAPPDVVVDPRPRGRLSPLASQD